MFRNLLQLVVIQPGQQLQAAQMAYERLLLAQPHGPLDGPTNLGVVGHDGLQVVGGQHPHRYVACGLGGGAVIPARDGVGLTKQAAGAQVREHGVLVGDEAGPAGLDEVQGGGRSPLLIDELARAPVRQDHAAGDDRALFFR